MIRRFLSTFFSHLSALLVMFGMALLVIGGTVRVSRFYELSEALSSEMPLDEQLAMVVELVRDNFGADGVSILVEDSQETGTFHCRASSGNELVQPKVSQLLANFIQDSPVLAHGEEVCRWLEGHSRPDSQVQSFMAAPLKIRGAPFGILGAFSAALGCILAPVMVIAFILMVIAWFVAAKEALDLEWLQTIITVVLGWLAFMVIMFVAGAILGLLGISTAAVGGAFGG